MSLTQKKEQRCVTRSAFNRKPSGRFGKWKQLQRQAAYGDRKRFRFSGKRRRSRSDGTTRVAGRSLMVICFPKSCRVGASIQFSCDDSYVLQGSKSITCQRVTETLAAWSDHRPICRSKCKYGLVPPLDETLFVGTLSDLVKWDVNHMAVGCKATQSASGNNYAGVDGAELCIISFLCLFSKTGMYCREHFHTFAPIHIFLFKDTFEDTFFVQITVGQYHMYAFWRQSHNAQERLESKASH